MNTIYLPDVVGGGYREFWHCRKRYRVVKGGKGSKKSSTAALWYIYHMMKLPESNLLVVRQVYRTHRDSTFAQLKWAIGRLGVERYWQALEYPLELRYRPTGQRILFRGFDDADKLASTTVSSGYLCWVWIEEAFEIRSEDAFDRLDLSAPRGEVPPPLFKQTTLTFNPWSAEHWLRGRFFESQRPEVLAMTTTYRCNEFLDQADLAVFEEMKRRQPQRYAVAGMGQWGVCEGLIYTDWRIEPFDIEEVKRDGGLQRVFDWITAIPTIPPPLLPQRWIRWDGGFTCMTSTMKKRCSTAILPPCSGERDMPRSVSAPMRRSPNPMRICGVRGFYG